MFKALVFLIILAGCQSLPEYDPVAAGLRGSFPINQRGFLQLKQGLSVAEVHALMGDQIIIDQQPFINPYRTENFHSPKGFFTVEYYIARVEQNDGIIDDSELIPVIFLDDHLYATGWSALKYLLPSEE